MAGTEENPITFTLEEVLQLSDAIKVAATAIARDKLISGHKLDAAFLDRDYIETHYKSELEVLKKYGDKVPLAKKLHDELLLVRY